MKKTATKRIGTEIVESLQEFLADLQAGIPLETFNLRRVEVRPEEHSYHPELIRKTRATLRASQAVFARFLGVSVQTIRAWEQGENVPSNIAKRFMDEIQLDPPYWRKRLREVVVPKRKKTA